MTSNPPDPRGRDVLKARARGFLKSWHWSLGSTVAAALIDVIAIWIGILNVSDLESVLVLVFGSGFIIVLAVVSDLMRHIKSLSEMDSGVATQQIERGRFRDDWFSRAVGIREKVDSAESLEELEKIRKEFVASVLEVIRIRIPIEGLRITYFSYENNGEGQSLSPYVSSGRRPPPAFRIDEETEFGRHVFRYFKIGESKRVDCFREVIGINKDDKGGLGQSADFESFAFVPLVRRPKEKSFGIFMIDHESAGAIEHQHLEFLYNVAVLCADGKYAIAEQEEIIRYSKGDVGSP